MKSWVNYTEKIRNKEIFMNQQIKHNVINLNFDLDISTYVLIGADTCRTYELSNAFYSWNENRVNYLIK